MYNIYIYILYITYYIYNTYGYIRRFVTFLLYLNQKLMQHMPYSGPSNVIAVTIFQL